MAQIFPRYANTLFRLAIVGAILGAAGIGYATMVLARSPYFTRSEDAQTQPIQFSHAHHVNGLGIDCRYCHTAVEETAHSNVPSTKTCMNCHSQMWVGAKMLEPVRESLKTGQSIEWKRLHRLADFVYFNHSIHVNKGFGCSACHGRVDHMQAVFQKGTLLMEWCLECHRYPEKYIRPRDQIFNMAFKAEDLGKTQEQLGKELVEKYGVRSLKECSTCHR